MINRRDDAVQIACSGHSATQEPQQPRPATVHILHVALSSADLTEIETSFVQSALSDGWISGTGRFVNRSPTALEALIRRRAKVSTRTTVVLQTFFENRAHPVVGPDDTEPTDRPLPP